MCTHVVCRKASQQESDVIHDVASKFCQRHTQDLVYNYDFSSKIKQGVLAVVKEPFSSGHVSAVVSIAEARLKKLPAAERRTLCTRQAVKAALTQ